MKSLLKLSFICGIVVFFSSCGKKNEAGKMIPENAMFVAQVNCKSLGNKLSWKEIQQTAIYQKAVTDSSLADWRKKFLENPNSSGIDFDEGLILFTATHEGNKYFAVEGKIKNQGDFDQFNKNLSEGAATKQGDVSIMDLKDNGVVGWKGNQFIYLMNPGSKVYDLSHLKDLMQMPNNNVSADRSAEFSALCKNLFSLKTDSSLAKNDKFATLLKEPGDIHLYQNTDAMINNSPAMGMLGMLKLDAFTKGNSSTYTINFDNGKMVVSQRMYVSKELSDIIKKYMGNSLDMDMIKKIPSNNVLGLFASNFKPEGITEMIKLTGVDGMINSYIQPMGFSLDDFSKATNGNWLLAFTDFKMNSEDSAGMNRNAPPGDHENMSPDFNYIFAAGIANKASLQKMLDAAKKTTSQMGRDSLVNYVMNDKIFAQSNHASFASQYLNGGSNTSFDFADKISGHPVAFYFDIHKFLSQISTWDIQKPGRKDMMEKSLNTWNNIISAGGEFNNGGFTFTTEINLVNKDSNSLQQLSNYFNQMFLIHEKDKTEAPDTAHPIDPLLVPPPVDTVK